MQKARRHSPKPAPTACRHAVSGTISLPLPGYFSPFPHGTSPLSVTREYLALEGGPPRFSPRFTGAVLLRNAIGRPAAFAYGTVALCGARFHALRLPRDFVTPAGPGTSGQDVLQPPGRQRVPAYTCRFGLIPFRSPLLGESRLISFPRGTEMFQFPRLASPRLCIQQRGNAALPALGFPIRESAGQRLFSASPRLIAAVHALHRLLVPRHPPCALPILTVIAPLRPHEP